jgi:hypothetical protein
MPASSAIVILLGTAIIRNLGNIISWALSLGNAPNEPFMAGRSICPQVDGGTTRRYGGTGLGLALVKEIVEVHKGQVNVESKMGMGSIFTVQLPLERAAKQQK